MNSSTPGGSRDRIIIRNLELRSVIGVEDWERLRPQRLVVDIEVRGDFSAVAESDDLADAVDYREICVEAGEVAANGGYKLIETLADRIASTLLAAHPRIASATVVVHKPLALAGFGRADVAVEVTRESDPGN